MTITMTRFRVLNVFGIGLLFFLLAPLAHALSVGDEVPKIDHESTIGRVNFSKAFKKEGDLLVLEWLNHKCPYVVKQYETAQMQSTQAQAKAMGNVTWWSVVSSAPKRQGAYESVKQAATDKDNKKSNADAVLLDPTGKLGLGFGATRTPHLFIVKAVKKGNTLKPVLAYQGAIDDHRSASHSGAKDANNFVLPAIRSIQAGKTPEKANNTPYGCTIKYADPSA